MRKLFYCAAVVLGLAACSESMYTEVVPEKEETYDLRTLEERAKGGDGAAFLELANCYRDGHGVKRDFMKMSCMAFQAERFGGIEKLEMYLDSLPKESEYGLLYRSIKCMDKSFHEAALLYADSLLMAGSCEGYTMKAIVAGEKDDTVACRHYLDEAICKGSSFAVALLVTGAEKGLFRLEETRLAGLAEQDPFLCMMLGDVYRGDDHPEKKNCDLAARYYLKAFDNAFMGRGKAEWLIHYVENGGNVSVSQEELEQLRRFAQD